MIELKIQPEEIFQNTYMVGVTILDKHSLKQAQIHAEMFPPKHTQILSQYTKNVNFWEAKVSIKRRTLSTETSFQIKTHAG